MNFANVKEWRILEGDVIRVTDSQNRIIWQKETIDYTEPFYVENLGGDTETVEIVKNSYTTDHPEWAGYAPSLTVEYSRNKTDWNTLGTTSATPLQLDVYSGEKIYLRCKTNAWATHYTYNSTSSLNPVSIDGIFYNTITGCSKVGGNIMSLLYGNKFDGQTNFSDTVSTRHQYAFYSLFSQAQRTTTNITLVSADKLLLPAETLVSYCYAFLFYNCEVLSSAPELPAVNLKGYCYEYLFRGCSSLVNVPELPAAIIPAYAYAQMFAMCTAIVNAPRMDNVTTVYSHGCDYMFASCTSLVSPPLLTATTISANSWRGMFANCTSLTFAPDINVQTLANQSCWNMFKDCTLLNTIKCTSTDISAYECTYAWLAGVSSTGTFYKKAGVTWPTGTSGIPSGWTVVEV